MIQQKKSRFPSFRFAVLSALALGGCLTTVSPYFRAEVAQRIAAPAWMVKRQIPAGPFVLTAYERIHDRGGAADVYIAGDGDVWESPREWELDPTPQNPVALHLASKDKADNVIYIAQPCQYSGMADKEESCAPALWHTGRYSEDAVHSVGLALDEIARRYDLKGLHLIGYSGGGAIAAILAATRSDVLSLRTVAGVLDHKAQSDTLGSAPLSDSLNPVDYTEKLSGIPQYHFIGGQDKYVPPAVLHSYLQKMPPTRCVQYKMIQEAEYGVGWVDKWPELLALPVTCHSGGPLQTFEDIRFEPLPVPAVEDFNSAAPLFTTREKPEKP